MRIAFLGTPEFALPSLEAARRRDELVVVVTQPDRPQGRGQRLASPPVKLAAEALGIPVLQPDKVRNGRLRDALAPYAPDLGVVVAYGRILPPEALALPRHGMINVHASLLPAYRGAAPIQWAVARGERTTGVTVQRVVEALDAGDVYVRRTIEIGPDETAGDLTPRLATLGGEALLDVLDQIREGRARPEPQDASRVTWAPILSKDDARLDPSLPAQELANRVRGFHPWPGAFLETAEGPLKIHRARATEGRGPPGTILSETPEGIAIACGEGALLVLEVQSAGKRRMSAAEYLAGRRAPLALQSKPSR